MRLFLLLCGTLATLWAAVPAGLLCLVRAYPWAIDHADETRLYFKDGSTMVYDLQLDFKSWEERINGADLATQMSQAYPTGWDYRRLLKQHYDPGRLRHQPFFEKLYGADQKSVEAHLVLIPWMPKNGGGTLRVTALGGVAEHLKAVSDELDRLPPAYRAYLLPVGGTYTWRPIAGTNRLSMHSFGIAIDINAPHSHYWRDELVKQSGPEGSTKEGSEEDAKLSYRNNIPRQIVEIFEKHGFIWGGKWYHYDTMHFEYRPELLDPACSLVTR